MTVLSKAFKQVYLVRTDVAMGKGKIASQCAHAAILAYDRTRGSPERILLAAEWVRAGQMKVVLKVASSSELCVNAAPLGLCDALRG